jgi:prevent-host-death family protein
VKKISATEANRNFSKLLARVRKGEPAEITVRGEAVVRMVPVSRAGRTAAASRLRHWEEFIERLRTQPLLGIPRGTRDELYEDD